MGRGSKQVGKTFINLTCRFKGQFNLIVIKLQPFDFTDPYSDILSRPEPAVSSSPKPWIDVFALL